MEILVKDIYKSFKGIECISDVSFTAYANEIVGVLAPRGSGKTLLLNLLSHKSLPDAGTIEFIIDEKPLTNKDIPQNVGYLDADNPLYPYMTAYDYLTFSASFYKLPSYLRRDRVRNLIKICGISHWKHKLVSELSKGQKQRLGIAQAMIHNPAFLLLDEPVSGLDPKQSEQLYELIREFGKERTIILTSSRMRDMENMCDTMLVLSNGKVLAKGTVEELQQEVANSSILKIEIKATDSTRVYEALQQIDYIQIVKYKGFSFDIHTTHEDRFARELFNICVDNNWYIRRLVAAEKTLEDTFKQLRKN
ncbi:ABC-2 type transport system ATP-binding protein [Balneicella halophila]|uniref:ABC-2 type transport system ATP-binding protein n=1 Tax=Balneicella halophila TaxID=1537566 RepID=A0A7L4UTI6_BALHA|nr:ABC transporter ATP-binding protein [Balneicella halophila]PVX52494.1 ABC-2 type transport system ATP-binding protein [Balneicella halophila]